MRTRKSVVLIGGFFVIALIGLVIVSGLAVLGSTMIRPVERPAHLPVGAAGWARATPLAYVTSPPKVTPAASLATDSGPAMLPEASAGPAAADTSPPDGPAGAAPVVSPTATADRPAGDWPNPPASTPVSPTVTDIPTLSPSITPSPGPTNMPTPTPVAPGRISGRVLLDGEPVGTGLELRLEDEAYNTVAQTSVKKDGSYVFPDLQPSSQGYNLVFAQEWNTQYAIDEVISWGWIGPVAVGSGRHVELPDLDISLKGFGQLNPEPNAAVSVAALSSDNPLRFEWSGYPQAIAYWVDLARGEEDEQEVIWQSFLSQGDSLPFDGKLENGKRIEVGEYWWGVGARSDAQPYPVIVYGYLSALRIKP